MSATPVVHGNCPHPNVWTASARQRAYAASSASERCHAGSSARDRSAVQIVLDDGSVLGGTLDRVGADYVELAEHPADLPRRAEAVQGVRGVVIAGIAVVRTLTPGLG